MQGLRCPHRLVPRSGREGGRTGKPVRCWMLAARTRLLNLRRDIDNQMRGLCKGLGILLGKTGSTNLARKVNAVLTETPDLQDIFAPILLARTCLTE